MLCSSYVLTPIGVLKLVCDDDSLLRIEFVDVLQKSDTHDVLELTKKQLLEYFNGTRREFSIPLKLHGTDFQQKVWQSLQNIQYGETHYYKDIATMIGNAKACRAVGNANNKNPIPIIIPCHRVVGANDRLVGYAGGLDKKEWLLNLEQKQKNTFQK